MDEAPSAEDRIKPARALMESMPEIGSSTQAATGERRSKPTAGCSSRRQWCWSEAYRQRLMVIISLSPAVGLFHGLDRTERTGDQGRIEGYALRPVDAEDNVLDGFSQSLICHAHPREARDQTPDMLP